MANNIPSWLSLNDYPKSGVGDLNHLKFFLGVGENAKWLGFVNTGWYYHNNLELYHYIVEGKIEYTAPAGTGSVAEAISFRPTWGPVLVYGSDDTMYEPIFPVLEPAQRLSWSLTGETEIYQADVPSGAVLVSMRDLTTLPMGSVSSTGELTSEKFYFLEKNQNRVFVKSSSSDVRAYADLLYSNPQSLKVKEIVINEENGVRPSYRLIENISIIRGEQTQTLAGPSSGFLTPTLTGLAIGDWVLLEYNVQKSYTLADHKTLWIFTTNAQGTGFTDDVEITYEKSVPDMIPPLRLEPNGVYSGLLDLNPTNAGSHRSGHLFHYSQSPPASSLWTVETIRVEIDKDRVVGDWNEVVKFTAWAFDSNDLPVPWADASLSIPNSNLSLLVTTPSSSGGDGFWDLTFDGRGEIHGLVQVGSSMTEYAYSISVTSDKDGVTGTVSGFVQPQRDFLDSTKYLNGQLNLIVVDEFRASGHQKGYASATYLDGIPDDRVIKLISEKASEFEVGNKRFTRRAEMDLRRGAENLSGFGEFGFLSQRDERLSALDINENAQSNKILETETPE